MGQIGWQLKFFKGWQSLADISTDHQNMHSYSVIAHDNDIYITGGHSSSQCTVDIVSGKLAITLNCIYRYLFSIFLAV